MRETLFYILSSFWIGAVHAATPGHGKTIAAAYIVGARGRRIDAVILGVFVTLSHTTGIVLVGVLASLGSVWLVPQRVEAYLTLATGLLVVGLGLWMLWTQRDLLALAMGDPSIARALLIFLVSRARETKKSQEMRWGVGDSERPGNCGDPALCRCVAIAAGDPHQRDVRAHVDHGPSTSLDQFGNAEPAPEKCAVKIELSWRVSGPTPLSIPQVPNRSVAPGARRGT
jgi:ABC-type nickel/cobalt efflux system permease component RcnA